MHRNRSDISQRFHIPNLAEKLFLCKDMVRILGEECQQVKLFRSKILLFPVDINRLAVLSIFQSPDFNYLILRCSSANQAFISGHMGFYSGNHLAGAEGLRNIVIRAQAQALLSCQCRPFSPTP